MSDVHATPAVEQEAPRALLPPYERIYNHAADQLIELLMDVAFNNLIDMCRDKSVAAAAKKFLAALVKARDRKPKRRR